jgi:hypothetical protein
MLGVLSLTGEMVSMVIHIRELSCCDVNLSAAVVIFPALPSFFSIVTLSDFRSF